MIVLGYIAAVLVGIVLGVLGGGGSILAVPLLVYVFGLSAATATTYSLFGVGITSLVGAVNYTRAKSVDILAGALFLFPSLAGVWLARRLLLPQVPDVVLDFGSLVLTKDKAILIVFAMVMGFASYSMLRPSQRPQVVSGSKHKQIPIYGFLAGLVMGFVGAGGGFLTIPVLVNLGKLEMKTAVGTSLIVISASSLFGFVSDLSAGTAIDWSFLLSFTACSVGGVFAGSKISKRIPSAKLKPYFGYMIAVISCLILVRELISTLPYGIIP